MRRFPVVAPTLLLALVTGACASAPSRDPTQTTHTETRVQAATNVSTIEMNTRDVRDERPIAAPTVHVFDQLPAAFRALGVTSVAVVDTMHGVYTVGARNLLLRRSLGGAALSTYLDCGTGAMNMATADHYDVYATLTSYATPAGSGGSVLHTYVTGQARDPMSNTPLVRCVSTGRFETALADKVTQLTAQ